MKKWRASKRSERRAQRLRLKGFTLLELMVTMVVVSMVVAAAYQLFATTSDAMYEADSLADTTDRARFALEMISREVRAAGAFASPDSVNDPFAHRAPADLRNIRGLYPFVSRNKQQISDQQLVFNLATRSDELIVMGAYDFPFSFEVSFPGAGTEYTQAVAPNSQRGALRFLRLDPFISDVNMVPDIGNVVNSVLGPGNLFIEGRLLRVVDRNGFSQYVSLIGASYTAGNAPTDGLTLNLDTTNPLLSRHGEERAGLEPGGEDDAGYDAALIDAYRYRVCQDQKDFRVLRLVRERLDASRLALNEAPPSPPICEQAAIGAGQFILEQHTIVDRVVDFRVWYDCTLVGDTLENARWETGWMVPDADDIGHNCAYLNDSGEPVDATVNPSMARMAHIRLSVRTETERRDLSNYGFLMSNGETINASNSANSTASAVPDGVGDLNDDVIGGLQTVDIDGDARNAARVVTLQVDIQLTNYINRARLSRPQDAGNEVFQ